MIEPPRTLLSKVPSEQHIPSPRVVAFIDLLGFRGLIARCADDPVLYGVIDGIVAGLASEQKRLASIVAERQSRAWNHPYDGIELAHFSDSVVISCGVIDNDLKSAAEPVLSLSSTLIGDMLQSGIYCRGGVAVGWAVHEANVIFGEAMIKAYELESTVAVVPRVLVADEIVSALTGFVRSQLLQDADGSFLIDPFHELWSGDQIAIPDYNKYALVGKHIKTALTEAKRDGPPAVIVKLRWLANLYNGRVKELDETWGKWAFNAFSDLQIPPT